MRITNLLVAACTASTVLAWGSLGHRTVAYLASLYLTPEATKFTNRLLNGQDISEAALFPDKIAHLPIFAYTRAWHYIDAADDPPRLCTINMTRDCLATSGCVVSAIANHTARVLDPSLPRFLQAQSLRFVLHFIGDIHQPLHTEKEDRGGNGIEVVFDGRRTNLHSVWDSLMPNKYRKRDEWWPGPPGDPRREREEEASFLWAKELFDSDGEAGDVSGECVSDAAECALEWAQEANGYVCSYVLRDDVEGVQAGDLGGEYYDGAVEILDEQVRNGGRRLAAWLNLMAEAVRDEGGDGMLVVQDELK
jgi:hypothetical protein